MTDSVLKMMNFGIINDEFCIKMMNDRRYRSGCKRDGAHRAGEKMMIFVLKMMIVY